ncbi:MAG TPA: amidohydrolase family protein [Chitinophaga sp.]|nr:amidohydrolase family protein [Chitinophaga sp.]
MAYRKFKADKLFTGFELLEEEQVLVTNEKGIVQAIIPASAAGDDVEVFKGILSPGFINCHCHLELSHLKDLIPPHTGLIEFLCSVVTKRDFDREVILSAVEKAEKEMYDNGIVAVGDIGNTADTLSVKSRSAIYWQNFIEVLSFTDAKAEENIAHYKEVLSAFTHTSHLAPHTSSLVPHAPYSISPKTFELINETTKGQVISIHNQEHPAEDDLYKTGGGDYLRLFKIFGVDQSPFPVTGKSSLRSVLPHFNNGQTILLVHNTNTSEEDIVWATNYAAENNISLVWCLCPNANLYIENKMPPVELFMKYGCPLVLGTDSYSSNWQLSIVKEVAAIHERLPKISLETILQWATINGAKALDISGRYGSFEKGKQPGVVLIEEDLPGARRLL